MTIGIDPGARASGWAQICDDTGRIIDAGLIRHDDRDLSKAITIAIRAMPARDHVVVVEEMIYRGAHSRASVPADLLRVQAIGAAIGASLLLCPGTLRMVPARTWKGNIPKSIHHRRLLDGMCLDDRYSTERALARTPKAHHKEVLDAIGIALWWVGR